MGVKQSQMLNACFETVYFITFILALAQLYLRKSISSRQIRLLVYENVPSPLRLAYQHPLFKSISCNDVVDVV